MAQPQVVNIQAMYEIGRAMHYQPDTRPTFMPWLQGVIGKFAVDMMYDTYETWRDERKMNNNLYSTQLNTIVGGGDGSAGSKEKEKNYNPVNLGSNTPYFNTMTTTFLENERDFVEKQLWTKNFALSKKKRKNSNEAINLSGSRVKNYQLNHDAYFSSKGYARDLVINSNLPASHNSAESFNFSTQLASGNLDKFMSNTEDGEWYLDAAKMQAYMGEVKEMIYGMQTMEGGHDEATLQSDAFKGMNKELRIYDNILNHSMNGKDLPVKLFNAALKDESHVISNHMTDRAKGGFYKKMANNSSDGIFPEHQSRKFISSMLRGGLEETDESGNISNWQNKINSTWFANTVTVDNPDGTSPAHEYLTKGVNGKIRLNGVEQDVIRDPFTMLEGEEGIDQVMQEYLGAMEMLKKENLTTGSHMRFLEDFYVDIERQEFQYHQDQEVEKQNQNNDDNPYVPYHVRDSLATRSQIDTAVKENFSIGSLRGITLNKSGGVKHFYIADEDGSYSDYTWKKGDIILRYERTGVPIGVIDPAKPNESRNLIYNNVEIQSDHRRKDKLKYEEPKSNQGTSRLFNFSNNINNINSDDVMIPLRRGYKTK